MTIEAHPETLSDIHPESTLSSKSGQGSLRQAWGGDTMTIAWLALAFLIWFGVMCETAPTLDYLG